MFYELLMLQISKQGAAFVPDLASSRVEAGAAAAELQQQCWSNPRAMLSS